MQLKWTSFTVCIFIVLNLSGWSQQFIEAEAKGDSSDSSRYRAVRSAWDDVVKSAAFGDAREYQMTSRVAKEAPVDPHLWDFSSIKKGTHPDVYMQLFGSILNRSNQTSLVTPKVDSEKARADYVVPKIPKTKLVDCYALLNGDKKEMERAKHITKKVPKVPILEEQYLEWCQNCDRFKTNRGYVLMPLTEEEEKYPLAFSIAVYKDIEQTERLLRAVYQPQNLYCIHVDVKSPLLYHQAVYALASCFQNVFVASHLDRIKWGDVTVLLPAMNCMRDFITYHRGKWKYFINLTGQEFPLVSNWELVQFCKLLNGANDIGGSKQRMEMERVRYRWRHKWSDLHFHSTLYNTMEPKEPDPYNLTFYKGELHGVFAHKMVEFLLESEIGQGYFRWVSDTGHPTEHYWNTLNYNVHLQAPGGYEGPEDVAHNYSMNQVARAKHWVQYNYGGRQCHGPMARGICVYGVGDLPWLNTRKELVANKFYLTVHSLGYDCLEERHRNRTALKDKVPFDVEFYKNLPTVKYGRKDGL